MLNVGAGGGVVRDDEEEGENYFFPSDINNFVEGFNKRDKSGHSAIGIAVVCNAVSQQYETAFCVSTLFLGNFELLSVLPVTLLGLTTARLDRLLQRAHQCVIGRIVQAQRILDIQQHLNSFRVSWIHEES